MTRRARDTFTGTLRPNDPRRFLIEAMLGAMGADGKIHEAEIASMQKHIEEHEIFSGLTEQQHAMMLQIAKDAIAFVADPRQRILAIAKGLPSRLHKLTALAMACEVVVADTFIDESEIRYLKILRRALRLDSHDFETIFLAAREKRSQRDLDARLAQLRDLIPSIVDLFALRSLSISNLTPGHRQQIVDLLTALPDFQFRDQDITAIVDRAYSRMHFSMDIEASVQRIAIVMPNLSDRYWALVYLMCADLENAANWRNQPFLAMAQRVFGIDPADLDLGPADAAAFASLLPRV